MSIRNVEIQDSNNNIYYPHTSAEVVKYRETSVAKTLDGKVNIDVAETISPKTLITVANFDNPNKNVIDRLFYVDEIDNMQGITFFDGFYYIGFDMGSENGKISKYGSDGVRISDTGLLKIGHSADLAFRKSNKNIYVANGGGTSPTHIYQVDFDTKRILKDYDLSDLGTSALVAIDNATDEMLIHTSKTGDVGSHNFTFIDFNTGAMSGQFTIPNQGVPQGLEMIDGYIYLYTNNKITIMNRTGGIVNIVDVTKSGESEGICLAGNYGTSFLAIGFNSPNRIYAFRTHENEKFNNLKSITPFNAPTHHNRDLMPRFSFFGIRKINGIWTNLDWGNYINSKNNIESIVVNSANKIIRIKLKTKYESVAFVHADAEQTSFAYGYIAHGQLDADGLTISIRIKKISTGESVDPAIMENACGITGYILGGVNIGY